MVVHVGGDGSDSGIGGRGGFGSLGDGEAQRTSRTVEPGDNIRMGPSGVTGVVQDVTWRYTSIKDSSGTVTNIPNSATARIAASVAEEALEASAMVKLSEPLNP